MRTLIYIYISCTYIFFILEYFSDKQLLVSSLIVIEGRLTKDMLSKNKCYNKVTEVKKILHCPT